jgi:MFS transporter, DHA1 family, tetracycline resistance protein
MASNKKAALSFIFVTLLIDVTGFGLIIPVVPDFIKELNGGSTSDASRIGGWLMSTYAAIQFLFAPIIGNLSDKYGRRPVLLISLFGFGIDYIIAALSPNLIWLFVARAISGITGASFTTASAYIADVSLPEDRTKNFGIIGAAFGVGFFVGPVIGGLLGDINIRLPFYVAAALCLLNCLYGYFILPESLSKDLRRPFEWKRANPIGSLLQLRKYTSIRGLFIALILIYIASHAVQSNWTYFAIEKFQWSNGMIGFSLALVGLLVGAVQGGLVRIVNPKIGNEKSIYIGLALYALGMLLFGLASSSWMMFVFLVPYCLGGIAGPALQATISGNVPPNEQGEIQGTLTSLMSVTTIFGPAIMTNLFAYFTSKAAPIYFPGASFILGALLMLISAIIAFRTLHPRYQNK